MELPGRIMALDVGDARTGVAVTDPSQTIVSPHAVVQQPSRDKAIAAILEMVTALEPILKTIRECEDGRDINTLLKGPIAHSGFTRLN